MTADRSRLYAAGAVLFILVWLAYANTLSAPFIFDDEPGILKNASIRSFAGALHAPVGSGAQGRPVVNLSLALNYALGGTDRTGYHAFNILVHALAALLLFGLVRRTLTRAGVAGAEPVAWLGAALWALHPLQTESVTCIIQRTESLMGFFYLATLYAFARGADSPRGGGWRAASVACCLTGMATKEVMVSAPLMVLLYDRTFVAGSFAAAWRGRRGYYAALAATWVLLAGLVIGAGGNRGGTAGWNAEIPPWHYLLTQCWAVVHYLRLSLFPYPLVLDYGSPVITSLRDVGWEAALLVTLFAGSWWAAVRRPWLGFCGLWFFLILAPSSSVVPLVTQTVAEHRMYLPLAALTVPVALGLHRWLGARGRWITAGLVLLGGLGTVARNQEYRATTVIWRDSVEHSPDPSRSNYYLGVELTKEDRLAEAEKAYQEAVRLKPAQAEAHNNLGNILARRGWLDAAAESYRAALRLRPGFVEAQANLVTVLRQAGRAAESAQQWEVAGDYYREGLRLEPGSPAARLDLGRVLLHRAADGWKAGRQIEAIALIDEAVRINPDDPHAHNSLGEVLRQSGRISEARAEFEAALRLQPDFAPARANLEGLAR